MSTCTSTLSICFGRRWFSRLRSSTASSAGCVAAHEGYSLTVIPVSRISQRLPRVSKGPQSRCSLAMATSNPCGPSIARSEAVNPAWASNAAITLFCAASPACNGLVMAPKFSLRPNAHDAAIPRQLAVALASRPSKRAQAALLPRVPMVEVQCQPLW